MIILFLAEKVCPFPFFSFCLIWWDQFMTQDLLFFWVMSKFILLAVNIVEDCIFCCFQEKIQETFIFFLAQKWILWNEAKENIRFKKFNSRVAFAASNCFSGLLVECSLLSMWFVLNAGSADQIACPLIWILLGVAN